MPQKDEEVERCMLERCRLGKINICKAQTLEYGRKWMADAVSIASLTVSSSNLRLV